MQAAYKSRSFPNLNIIYGSGRNSSFVEQGTHHLEFLCFSKDKSLKLQYHLEQDKLSLDLLISYLSITQTQIKHMLRTSFKFSVNSYIKIVVSKTRENSRLKTRYLKGITTQQLFIISISRDYLRSPFCSALKNRKLDTLLFCFLTSLDHTLLIYM